MAKKILEERKELNYKSIIATCACGAEFKTGSLEDKLHVDICTQCHPFFTGEKKFIDTEGRVEKFRKKYNLDKK